MEEILSNNTISLPLGIKCMELSIKEADAAIKDFLKNNRYVFDFSTTPSWKFPHINIEKLEVLNVMKTYRIRSVSEEKQYLELMEILIDRLYFSLIATYQFLTSTGMLTGTSHQIGQGDCQQSPVKMPWDIDQFQIGDILKHIHAKLISMDTTSNTRRKLEKSISRTSVKDDLKLRHTLTQTKLSGLEGCESCYFSQNTLKLLADMVALCFKTLSQEESQIAKFRTDEADQAVWLYSQRSMVVKWCELMESDCHIMLEKAGKILEQNAACKEEVENCQLKNSQEAAGIECIMNDIKNKLESCEEELENERKLKRKAIKLRDSTIVKSNEVERQLYEMKEETKRRELEQVQLHKDMKDLRSTHRQLHLLQNSTVAELQEAKRELGKVDEEKAGLSRRISGLEIQIDLKDEEIVNLKKLLDKYEKNDKEKLELRKTLAATKHQLQVSKKAEMVMEKANEINIEEIQQLKESLELTKAQIELLTLYPDLNGPINPPSRETGNPLEAMELQLKSNNLRMDILKSQTDRLTTTLDKIRSHMKSN